MYSQIEANKRMTNILFIIFFSLIIAIGYVLGKMTGDSVGMVGIAGIISIVMALTSYYGGDKMALATSRAKQITSEQNPYLYKMVENLCITSGIPLPKIHIIEDDAINAFATGRDPKHASIAVTTGAINKLENEELEGVLAHELSHIQNYDIRVMTIVIVLVGIISLLGDWMWYGRGFRGSDREGGNVFMIVGIVLIVLSPIFAKLIQLAISRRREYLADASGSLLTRYPEGLARALEKIKNDTEQLSHPNHATAHLYISSPFKGAKNLFSTHPPLEDRIAKLRAM